MKFPKITKKLLPVALALVMTTSFAYAEDGEPATPAALPDIANGGTGDSGTSATALYQLTLAEFFDIDVQAPGTPTVTVDTDDYKTISISDVESVFEVITNKNTGAAGENGEPVYVIATCETDSASNTPALAGDKGALALIFTNVDNKPDAASVEHIRGGNATSTGSPNAIAFSMTELYQHEETSKNGFVGDDYTFNKAKGQLGYSVANGKHHFTYTVGGSAYNSSFSTMDMAGTYKATLTMQRSSI